MYGYSNLSGLYSDNNNLRPAYESALIAARIAKKMGDKGMEATNLAKAAMSLVLQHNYKEANTLCKQAIAIVDSSRQPFNINQVYTYMGKILNYQGKYKDAPKDKTHPHACEYLKLHPWLFDRYHEIIIH